ncbi:MAG: hypothetical protein ABSC77_09960 [Terracidiphilus sp.]|jgi:hypothetical protein
MICQVRKSGPRAPGLKREDTVTGQQESVADLYDIPPAFGKRLELRNPFKRNWRGPNVISGDLRPERYAQTFKPSKRTKSGVSYLLDRQYLEYEAADGAGTRIHHTVIGGGSLAFHVSGFELSVPPVPLIAAEPHDYDIGDCEVLPECVPDALGEKGLSKPLRVVKNNSGLESNSAME